MFFDNLGEFRYFDLKLSKSSAFMRYFDQPLWMLQNALGPMNFDVWQSRKTLSICTNQCNVYVSEYDFAKTAPNINKCI